MWHKHHTLTASFEFLPLYFVELTWLGVKVSYEEQWEMLAINTDSFKET